VCWMNAINKADSFILREFRLELFVSGEPFLLLFLVSLPRYNRGFFVGEFVSEVDPENWTG
jgi:hypothetical protein